MLKLFSKRASAFIAASAFLLGACGSSGSAHSAFSDEDSILRFVPSDTPYLLATGEQVPDELLDEIEPEIEMMMEAYQVLIRAALEEAVNDSDAPVSGEQVEWLAALLDELTALVSAEGLRNAGFERGSRMVFFGHGLLPVMRIELSDAQKFDDMIGRIEDAAEQDMMVGDIDGESYRYAGGEAGNFVIGAFEGDAVFTFLPSTMGDDELRQLVGLSLPDENIAETSTLTDIVDKYGFTNHYVGLIDTMRVVSTFIDEPTGLDAVLLEGFEYDNSELSNVCREEIRETAAVAPRMVVGYETISVEEMSGVAVVELREDIASGLSTIASIVPGLGTDPGGLLSLGMSFDVGAFRSFLEARVAAAETDPYECELFADLQRGLEQGRDTLNQPLPPVAYSFRGINAVVDDIEGLDLSSDVPPAPDTVHASVLVAMDDAQAMLAMGALLSPELAALNLQPDGNPVPLDLPQVQQFGVTAYAAMIPNALAVSIGDNAEDRVTEVLAADGVEPPTSFSMTMDAGKYYELVAAGMMDDEEGLPLEAREAARDAMLAIGDIYDRMAFDVRFTADGVELTSKVTLAQ